MHNLDLNDRIEEVAEKLSIAADLPAGASVKFAVSLDARHCDRNTQLEDLFSEKVRLRTADIIPLTNIATCVAYGNIPSVHAGPGESIPQVEATLLRGRIRREIVNAMNAHCTSVPEQIFTIGDTAHEESPSKITGIVSDIPPRIRIPTIDLTFRAGERLAQFPDGQTVESAIIKEMGSIALHRATLRTDGQYLPEIHRPDSHLDVIGSLRYLLNNTPKPLPLEVSGALFLGTHRLEMVHDGRETRDITEAGSLEIQHGDMLITIAYKPNNGTCIIPVMEDPPQITTRNYSRYLYTD